MKRVNIILAVGLVLLMISGCTSTSSTSSTTTTTTSGVATHAMVGTWSGTWTDTAFGVNGSLSATISQNGSALTGTGTIGLSSLGLVIEAGTASGTISGNNVTFSFNAATVGSGSGTISGNTVTGTGEVTGALAYGSFTFAGTISANGNTMTGTFTGFASGGQGTASLTKQ